MSVFLQQRPVVHVALPACELDSHVTVIIIGRSNLFRGDCAARDRVIDAQIKSYQRRQQPTTLAAV